MAKKILFAYEKEDEVLEELALELHLQYDIIEAHDVKTAIKLLKESRILTLVIADNSLYLASSLLEALRADKVIIGIPFIAMSHTLEKDKLIKAGADAFHWHFDGRKHLFDKIRQFIGK